MAFTIVQYKRFCQAQFPSAWTNVYTVTAATQDILKGIDIVNASPSGCKVSVAIVPSGGAPGPANALFYLQLMAASGTIHWAGTQVMNAGDSIYIQSDVPGAATITASGLEAT